MSVYVVVQLKMKNRARYDRYQEKFAAIFSAYSGRLLAADEHPELIEGTWHSDKVVLMEFPDKDSFTQWADSPEYVTISEDRKAGAEATVLLVKGY